MNKLADLEPESFLYDKYTDAFQDKVYSCLDDEKRFYPEAPKCGSWDYRTCLA